MILLALLGFGAMAAALTLGDRYAVPDTDLPEVPTS